MWATIAAAVLSGVKSFLGMKEKQVETVTEAIKVAKSISSDDKTAKQAAAAIIAAEAQSSHWLAAVWRPAAMVIFLSLILAHWLGYTPENMSPAEISRLYDLLELGLGGYIGGRTIEKVVSSLSLSSLLKKLTD